MAPTIPLPSQKLNRFKQADPWNQKKSLTRFSKAYASNEIPCRINHGGVKSDLIWKTEPEQLEFNPLLVDCCEGFAERQHPFVFLSRKMFFALLRTPDAAVKLATVIDRLVPLLRRSLSSKHNDEVEIALKAIEVISSLLKEDFIPHVAKLTAPLGLKFRNRQLKMHTRKTMMALVDNCGDSALNMIRKKVPNFS